MSAHSSLTPLNLAHNFIPIIMDNLFRDLAVLSSLTLSSNHITVMQNNPTLVAPFVNISTLSLLQLSGNKITTIEVGALSGLPHLKWLHVENNLLSAVSPGTLEDLSDVKGLFVTNNDITILQNGTFLGLVNVEQISFRNNDVTIVEAIQMLLEMKSLLTRLTHEVFAACMLAFILLLQATWIFEVLVALLTTRNRSLSSWSCHVDGWPYPATIYNKFMKGIFLFGFIL